MANKAASRQNGRVHSAPSRLPRQGAAARVPRPAPRSTGVTVDVVLLTPLGKRMGVLVQREQGGRGRESATLPWGAQHNGETLEAAALRIARSALGTVPAWMEQVGAFGDPERHPGDSDLSVAFVGVVPNGTEPPEGDSAEWAPLTSLPAIAPRHRTIASAAFDSVRSRLERFPVAFRLLPSTFTLSELQHTYELLLGRRLHKASFRRALQTAGLVAATGEWRSEGRGRPAQLFKYAPKKKRGPARGIRF